MKVVEFKLSKIDVLIRQIELKKQKIEMNKKEKINLIHEMEY